MHHDIALPSGLWRGHYEQAGRRYPQELVLEFADGIVRGDGSDVLGTFVVEGEYRAEGDDVPVGWIKTYDGAHSVLYLGALRAGALEGRWSLGGYSSGGFLLRHERGVEAP